MTDAKTEIQSKVREAWREACELEAELDICVGRVIVKISAELAKRAEDEGVDLAMPGWDAVIEVLPA